MSGEEKFDKAQAASNEFATLVGRRPRILVAKMGQDEVVCSIYDEGFDGSLDKKMSKKLELDGISEESANTIKKASFDNMNAIGIEHADAIIIGSDGLNEDTMGKISSAGVPVLDFPGKDGYLTDINAFYDQVLGVESEATT